MALSSVKHIRTAKKEAQLFREISRLFLQASIDDARIQGVFINRVHLSSDGGICYVYFYSANGIQDFEAKLPFLMMYKPSLRKALADSLHARYTPNLVFKYDDKFEKQDKLEKLLNTIKYEESGNDNLDEADSDFEKAD